MTARSSVDGGDGDFDGAYMIGGEVVDADAEDVFARCVPALRIRADEVRNRFLRRKGIPLCGGR